jgi:hypothetical protein
MDLTPQGKLRSYELTIWLPGKGAMRDVVQGMSLNHAIQVARNRYPNCMVEVPPLAASKPKLARSYTGRNEAANRRLRLLEKHREQQNP